MSRNIPFSEMRHGHAEETLREVVICLGANCGSREHAVERAVAWLRTMLDSLSSSPLYETPDSHGGPRRYINAVCRGYTVLSQPELDLKLKGYETANGRDAAARCRGDVPIDVDIVIFGGEVVRPRDYVASFFRWGFGMLQDATR